MNLAEYVNRFVQRGDCTCGKCCDAPENPKQPTGHTADVYFFKVAAKEGASKDDLSDAIKKYQGEFCKCDPLDGKEHSYIELGGWIGSQNLALQMMGLGAVLGLWDLMTPKSLPDLPKELMDQMAGQGMVSIVPKNETNQDTDMNPEEKLNKRIAEIHDLDGNKFTEEINIRHAELKAMFDALLGLDYDQNKFEQVKALQCAQDSQHATLISRWKNAEIGPVEYAELLNSLNDSMKKTFIAIEQVLGVDDFTRLFGEPLNELELFKDMDVIREPNEKEKAALKLLGPNFMDDLLKSKK